MSKPQSSDAVGLYVVLALILFTIFTLVNSLLFGRSCGKALSGGVLMTTGCFLLLLFVAWVWPKIMWLSVWLRWLRRSWWWERRLKPKKYQLVWLGKSWVAGIRWLGPYPSRPDNSKWWGCVYRWRLVIGPLEIRKWERKIDRRHKSDRGVK